MAGSLCGIWVDEAGSVHTTIETGGGGRESRVAGLRPFAWLNAEPEPAVLGPLAIEELKGEGPYSRLVHADTLAAFNAFNRTEKFGLSADIIRPLESQFLLQQRERMYRDMTFGQLRRCQVDIEVASPDGGFPDASRAEDRVLAIGLRFGAANRLLLLDEMTDAAEQKLLSEFCAAIGETGGREALPKLCAESASDQALGGGRNVRIKGANIEPVRIFDRRRRALRREIPELHIGS